MLVVRIKARRLVFGPEVNSLILLQFFEAGRKQRILNKDVFGGGEFKLIGSCAKSDIGTNSGGILFLSVCILVETKMSNFSVFRFIACVTHQILGDLATVIEKKENAV